MFALTLPIQAEDLEALRDSIIDEGARERGGCAWCGAKEFGFAGQGFHDLGEARRCEGCFMHRKPHEDLERDLEDWNADVSLQSGYAHCLLPEDREGAQFTRLGRDRRCHACYKFRQRHKIERPRDLIQQHARKTAAIKAGCQTRLVFAGGQRGGRQESDGLDLAMLDGVGGASRTG